MSHHAYVQSLELMSRDRDFSAYIMAAMRTADTGNLALLQMSFPQVWEELDERYNAPGGFIGTEGPDPVGQAAGDFADLVDHNSKDSV